MKATLTAAHENVLRDGSKNPAMEGLAKTLNNVSVRVRQAHEQWSLVPDTELVDLLANLNIIPGECADKAAIEVAQVWATVEDREDVVEAMRLDTVDEMTGQLRGTGVGGVDSTDDEKEGGADERTGRGGTVPSPYAEISSRFGLLERAAEKGGNDNAFHLQKARISFIEAHASKPVRQADRKGFF